MGYLGAALRAARDDQQEGRRPAELARQRRARLRAARRGARGRGAARRAAARAGRGRGRVPRRVASPTTTARPVLRRRLASTSRPGARVGIAGATGAGKTTLVSLLTRFYDPTAGRDPARRRRPARLPARRPAQPVRDRAAGAGAVLDQHRREHRLRPPGRRPRRRSRRRRRAANAHDFIVRAARGLRDAGRRARHAALRRRAPAHLAGPGVPQGRADPDPRRADELGGRRDRGGDHGGDGAADGGPDDVHDRPPAEHARVDATCSSRSRPAADAARRRADCRRTALRRRSRHGDGRSAVSAARSSSSARSPANPYAGMAWMHMQIVAGPAAARPRRLLLRDDLELAVRPRARREGLRLRLRRALPRPRRQQLRPRRLLGVPAQLLRRRVARHGRAPRAESLLADADAVFNVAGSTPIWDDGLELGPLVYFGTDPVLRRDRLRERRRRQMRACARPARRCGHLRREHRHARLADPAAAAARGADPAAGPARPLAQRPARRATRSPPSATGGRTGRTSCSTARPTAGARTTSSGRSSTCRGRTSQPIELATNLAPAKSILHSEDKDVRALGVEDGDRLLLEEQRLDAPRRARRSRRAPGRTATTSARPAREFTVARDLNVRLKSGWFSERSACYLAAGRPGDRAGHGLRRGAADRRGPVRVRGRRRRPRGDRGGRTATTSATAGRPRAIAEEYFAAETRAREAARRPRAVNRATRSSSSTPTTSATRPGVNRGIFEAHARGIVTARA